MGHFFFNNHGDGSSGDDRDAAFSLFGHKSNLGDGGNDSCALVCIVGSNYCVARGSGTKDMYAFLLFGHNDLRYYASANGRASYVLMVAVNVIGFNEFTVCGAGRAVIVGMTFIGANKVYLLDCDSSVITLFGFAAYNEVLVEGGGKTDIAVATVVGVNILRRYGNGDTTMTAVNTFGVNVMIVSGDDGDAVLTTVNLVGVNTMIRYGNGITIMTAFNVFGVNVQIHEGNGLTVLTGVNFLGCNVQIHRGDGTTIMTGINVIGGFNLQLKVGNGVTVLTGFNIYGINVQIHIGDGTTVMTGINFIGLNAQIKVGNGTAVMFGFNIYGANIQIHVGDGTTVMIGLNGIGFNFQMKVGDGVTVMIGFNLYGANIQLRVGNGTTVMTACNGYGANGQIVIGSGVCVMTAVNMYGVNAQAHVGDGTAIITGINAYGVNGQLKVGNGVCVETAINWEGVNFQLIIGNGVSVQSAFNHTGLNFQAKIGDGAAIVMTGVIFDGANFQMHIGNGVSVITGIVFGKGVNFQLKVGDGTTIMTGVIIEGFVDTAINFQAQIGSGIFVATSFILKEGFHLQLKVGDGIAVLTSASQSANNIQCVVGDGLAIMTTAALNGRGRENYKTFSLQIKVGSGTTVMTSLSNNDAYNLSAQIQVNTDSDNNDYVFQTYINDITTVIRRLRDEQKETSKNKLTSKFSELKDKYDLKSSDEKADDARAAAALAGGAPADPAGGAPAPAGGAPAPAGGAPAPAGGDPAAPAAPADPAGGAGAVAGGADPNLMESLKPTDHITWILGKFSELSTVFSEKFDTVKGQMNDDIDEYFHNYAAGNEEFLRDAVRVNPDDKTGVSIQFSNNKHSVQTAITNRYNIQVSYKPARESYTGLKDTPIKDFQDNVYRTLKDVNTLNGQGGIRVNVAVSTTSNVILDLGFSNLNIILAIGGYAKQSLAIAIDNLKSTAVGIKNTVFQIGSNIKDELSGGKNNIEDIFSNGLGVKYLTDARTSGLSTVINNIMKSDSAYTQIRPSGDPDEDRVKQDKSEQDEREALVTFGQLKNGKDFARKALNMLEEQLNFLFRDPERTNFIFGGEGRSAILSLNKVNFIFGDGWRDLGYIQLSSFFGTQNLTGGSLITGQDVLGMITSYKNVASYFEGMSAYKLLTTGIISEIIQLANIYILKPNIELRQLTASLNDYSADGDPAPVDCGTLWLLKNVEVSFKTASQVAVIAKYFDFGIQARRNLARDNGPTGGHRTHISSTEALGEMLFLTPLWGGGFVEWCNSNSSNDKIKNFAKQSNPSHLISGLVEWIMNIVADPGNFKNSLESLNFEEYLKFESVFKGTEVEGKADQFNFFCDSRESDDLIVTAGEVAYVIGGDGSDVIIIFTEVVAMVFGGNGNDVILVLSHRAMVYGGAGNDMIFVSGQKIFVRGDAGDDIIIVHAFSDKKITDEKGINYSENHVAVQVNGGAGNDLIIVLVDGYQKSGPIHIVAGGGDDIIIVFVVTESKDESYIPNVTIEDGDGVDFSMVLTNGNIDFTFDGGFSYTMFAQLNTFESVVNPAIKAPIVRTQYINSLWEITQGIENGGFYFAPDVNSQWDINIQQWQSDTRFVGSKVNDRIIVTGTNVSFVGNGGEDTYYFYNLTSLEKEHENLRTNVPTESGYKFQTQSSMIIRDFTKDNWLVFDETLIIENFWLSKINATVVCYYDKSVTDSTKWSFVILDNYRLLNFQILNGKYAEIKFNKTFNNPMVGKKGYTAAEWDTLKSPKDLKEHDNITSHERADQDLNGVLLNGKVKKNILNNSNQVPKPKLNPDTDTSSRTDVLSSINDAMDDLSKALDENSKTADKVEKDASELNEADSQFDGVVSEYKQASADTTEDPEESSSSDSSQLKEGTQKVYIRKNAGVVNNLSIAEIKVLDVNGNELKITRITNSKSWDDNKHKAANVADGNTGGSWTKDGIFSSQTKVEGWIQVEVAAGVKIGRVIVYGRNDGYQDQNGNFTVYISDQSMGGVSHQTLKNTAGVTYYEQKGQGPRSVVAHSLVWHEVGAAVPTNYIQNGGFEIGRSGLYETLPGWKKTGKTGASGSTWSGGTPTEGKQLFVLGGWSQQQGGGIEQDVHGLTPGELFVLSFDAATRWNANWQYLGVPLKVTITDSRGTIIQEQTYTFHGQEGMRRHKLVFKATSEGVKVHIKMPESQLADYDVDVDNIRVEATVAKTFINIRKNSGANQSASFGEVVVFDDDGNQVKVLEVTNSKPWDEDNHKAANVADGNTGGSWTEDGISSSQATAESWIQLEVAAGVKIGRVIVYGRNDGYEDQNGKFTVYISDQSMGGVSHQTLKNTAGVTYYEQKGQGPRSVVAHSLVWHEVGAAEPTNYIQNGGFEMGRWGLYETLPGWIKTGKRGLSGSTWSGGTPTEGRQLFVLNGWSEQQGGGIEQDVHGLTPGELFVLSFDAATRWNANWQYLGVPLKVTVTDSSGTVIQEQTYTFHGQEGMRRHKLVFKATSESVKVHFEMPENQVGDYDVDLDNIRVEATVAKQNVYIRKNSGADQNVSFGETVVFDDDGNQVKILGVTSSKPWDEDNHKAANAVDGNTGGSWTEDGIFSSETNVEGWLQLEVAAGVKIGRVIVYGRNDGYEDQNGKFTVYISDQSMGGVSHQTLKNTAGMTYYEANQNQYRVDIHDNMFKTVWLCDVNHIYNGGFESGTMGIGESFIPGWTKTGKDASGGIFQNAEGDRYYSLGAYTAKEGGGIMQKVEGLRDEQPYKLGFDVGAPYNTNPSTVGVLLKVVVTDLSGTVIHEQGYTLYGNEVRHEELVFEAKGEQVVVHFTIPTNQHVGDYDVSLNNVECKLVDSAIIAIHLDNKNNLFEAKSEHETWITPTNGILFYDKNLDGQVTNKSEYTFEGLQPETPYSPKPSYLLTFDDNGDGIINSKDAKWESFNVWIDSDGNGASSAGEVFSLMQVGINEIFIANSMFNSNDNSTYPKNVETKEKMLMNCENGRAIDAFAVYIDNVL